MSWPLHPHSSACSPGICTSCPAPAASFLPGARVRAAITACGWAREGLEAELWWKVTSVVVAGRKTVEVRRVLQHLLKPQIRARVGVTAGACPTPTLCHFCTQIKDEGPFSSHVKWGTGGTSSWIPTYRVCLFFS